MKKIGIIFLLLVFLQNLLYAQKTDKKLQQRVAALLKTVNGDAGVYIKNLRTGKIVAVNADTLFPTASMIKIPILTGIMQQVYSGERKLSDKYLYNDSLLYEGEDILGSFKSGENISLSKLIMLMLTTSDNTASLWLQRLAGSGSRINEIMDSLGFQYTRVNSRTPGRYGNWQRYGWGQTTPREMVRLMEKIYNGTLFDKATSEKMLRMLGRNIYDGVAISQVPPYIFVASKNGAVNDSRSETLLVMAPHGPYIFSVITKNLQDQRWDNDTEAWTMMRKLSALLWNYFEPKSDWQPPQQESAN